MKNYKTKFKHIFPVFLGITIASILSISLFRWLFVIQFEIFTIKEEVFNLWLPLIFPWIPITIWLRPKLRVLVFKDNDKGRFFFQIVAWGTICAALFVSQNYLTTATGALTKLSTIDEIDKPPKTRYYTINTFEVAKKLGGSHADFRASGKYNQYFDMTLYFVFPITTGQSKIVEENLKHWYGVKYHEQISNKISPEEKEKKYKLFWEKSVKDFENYDFKNVNYFENLPYSDDQQGFAKAAENAIKRPIPNEVLILNPKHEDFNKRNGNKLPWIFGSLGIGFSVFLLLLLWPKLNAIEYKNQLKGKKPKHDDILDMLSYLIPRGDHFATSIILDINIAVFLLMIFSGTHILYPNGAELLEWGANRRTETINGDWWRLLTSMFIHGGFMHLFLNIAGLAIAAIFVEPILGRTKYFLLYFFSGIVGSISSIIWYKNTVSVGASGAIFGLYGAILGLLLTDAFPKEGKKGIFMFIGIYVAINLLFGLTGGIDNAAHLGGLVSGAIVGIALFSIDKKLRENNEL